MLRLYEGHFRNLLNYLGLEAVMADLSAWLNARIPAKTLVVQP